MSPEGDEFPSKHNSWMSQQKEVAHRYSVLVVYKPYLPYVLVVAGMLHIIIIWLPIFRWVCSLLLFVSIVLFMPIQKAKIKCTLLVWLAPIEYAVFISLLNPSPSFIIYGFLYALSIIQNLVFKILAPREVLFPMHWWLVSGLMCDAVEYVNARKDKWFDILDYAFFLAAFHVLILLSQKVYSLFRNQDLLGVHE